MELTKEQIEFYNDLDNLSDEERYKFICDAKDCIQNTGFNYTMSIISGKYKMIILYTIGQFGTIRTNEMQRYIKGISFKTLSANLKELERDELIIRHEYPQIPPRVEYELSEKGKSLIPIFNALCAWGYQHR